MYTWPLFSASQGRFDDGIEAILFELIFCDKYVPDIRFHSSDFNQAQLPAFNGPGYLDINKPADNTTDNHCNHAPKTNGNNSPNFEGGMKKYQNGSKGT